MTRNVSVYRRSFLRAGVASAALALPVLSAQRKKEEEDVSPAEDLMREHGILKRVILIYRESIRRIDSNAGLPPETLHGAANLIRTFVEDYHEKLEEDYLFPRFQKAGKLVDLTTVLKQQHDKGRILTDRILQNATSAGLKDPGQRHNLTESLQLFIRMYEPHEAREDTVLFPAFHKLVSQHEYDSLGEEFEKKENQLFGGDGFEKNVDAVAKLERSLGIYDLTNFTPNV
jgi:hemerythrin-like domain-containing protein